MDLRERVTGPSLPPAVREEVKTYMRIEGPEEDARLDLLIPQVMTALERYIRRSLLTQVWKIERHCFPETAQMKLELLFPPLVTVDSVLYLDEEGVQQTLPATAYHAVRGIPPYLLIRAGQSWPVTDEVPYAVSVQYTTGHADWADVDDRVKTALLMEMEHFADDGYSCAELSDRARSHISALKVYDHGGEWNG